MTKTGIWWMAIIAFVLCLAPVRAQEKEDDEDELKKAREKIVELEKRQAELDKNGKALEAKLKQVEQKLIDDLQTAKKVLSQAKKDVDEAKKELKKLQDKAKLDEENSLFVTTRLQNEANSLKKQLDEMKGVSERLQKEKKGLMDELEAARAERDEAVAKANRGAVVVEKSQTTTVTEGEVPLGVAAVVIAVLFVLLAVFFGSWHNRGQMLAAYRRRDQEERRTT
jgi:predicted RND superfamily exporter protein